MAVLLIFVLTGCCAKRTNDQITSVNGEVKSVADTNIIDKEKSTGYLPKPFSLKNETEIIKIIQDYFDAIDRKEFSRAYDMWAQPQAGTKKDFIVNFQSQGVEHVKTLSMEKYIFRKDEARQKVADNVPSPYFFVVLDYKAKEPSSTNFYPDIKRDKSGQWKIYGLNTSPIPSEL